MTLVTLSYQPLPRQDTEVGKFADFPAEMQTAAGAIRRPFLLG